MTTRRSFLVGAATAAAATAAGLAAAAKTESAAATGPPLVAAASPTAAPAAAASAPPTPAPAASTPPSRLARDLARSLQSSMPQAKLSDALTEQIAADIEGNFAIAKTFRGVRLRNGQEPDFVFFADSDGECK